MRGEMPFARQPSAAIGGQPDDVEAAFYDALQAGDIERLMACWADEDDICCVHPAGPRLLGATAIRAAFETLFAAGTLRISPQRVHRVAGLACAVHSVLERVEIDAAEGPRVAYVIATNVYLKTAQGWRLVAHHASPATAAELQDIMPSPAVLH